MTQSANAHAGQAIPVQMKKPMFRQWRAALLLLPLMAVLSLFSLAPAVWVLTNSVKVEGLWSFAHFVEILG